MGSLGESRSHEDSAPGAATPDRLGTGLWAVCTAILGITAGFQFYRGAPVDGMIFGIAFLVALVGRRHDAGEPMPAAGARVPFLVAGGVAVSVAAAVLPRYAGADTVIFALVGLVVLIRAGRAGTRPDGRAAGTRRRLDRPLIRALVAWSVLIVALAALELTGYFLSLAGPRAEWRHPPLSDVVTTWFDQPWSRLILGLLWVWAGMELMTVLGMVRPSRAARAAVAEAGVSDADPDAGNARREERP